MSRSGYTGEDGYEIGMPADRAEEVVRLLLAQPDVLPIGLGARDSLRLEAGLCLYGSDLDATTTPVEASLEWAIQKTRRSGGERAGGFPGAGIVLEQVVHGASRRRVGLRPEGRAPLRAGAPLFRARRHRRPDRARELRRVRPHPAGPGGDGLRGPGLGAARHRAGGRAARPHGPGDGEPAALHHSHLQALSAPMTEPGLWTDTQAPADSFARRHIGPDDAEVAAMLAAIDAPDLDALTRQTVPESIRLDGAEWQAAGLGAGMTEPEVLARLRAVAGRNRVLTTLIGQGYHGTVLPGVIQRNILENPAWYTAYTPYQPEIAQGRLEALLTFQTLVCDLTGLDVANASLLDEATAAAEAMTLCRRMSKSRAQAFLVDAGCHPQTVAVLRTRAEPLGIALVVADPDQDLDPATVFGALLQYPDTFGRVRDPRALIARLHAAGALVAMAADPLALTLLTPPGALGADIAVGSMQRYGVPMGYRRPARGLHGGARRVQALHAGPAGGRVDRRRRPPAYRLALQTREQHIRREKATSNICTAQVLLAVIASMYAVYHGPDGLQAIARRVNRTAQALAAGLAASGHAVENEAFFDTVTVRTGARTEAVLAAAVQRGINLRRIDDDRIGISVDETTGPDTVRAVWAAFGGDAVAESGPRPRGVDPGRPAPRPAVHDAPGVPRAPFRDRDAALPAPAVRPRPGAGPHHDPARLLHHEAERHGGDGADHLARLLRHPPVRAGGAGARLRRAVRRPRSQAVRDQRLRRRVAAAQLRGAGRVRGPAGDTRLPPRAR